MAFDLETEPEFETDLEMNEVDTVSEDILDNDVDVVSDFDESEFIDEEVTGETFDISGVDPELPTDAKPGSDDKVLMLAARYAAGLPLWHNSDCYDHGPGIKNLFNLDN